MKKRWISRMTALLLCLALAAGVLPGTARAADDLTVTIDTGASVTLKDTDGNGYYEVGTADELYAFGAAVNGGNERINAELTADIAVNPGTLSTGGAYTPAAGETLRKWIPIGSGYSGKYYFRGHFQGNGHIVSDLYYSDTSDYVGLFGAISGSTVENVHIRNSYFYSNGGDDVGSIVGYAFSSTVRDCSSNAAVKATAFYVGGIVGRTSKTTVQNCRNEGPVSGRSYAGGIVGGNVQDGSVSNCCNTGAVTGTENVGGVGGRNILINNCYNTGSVSGTEYVGGVGGTCVVNNCYNTGSVSGTSYVGGLAGYALQQIVNSYYDNQAFTGAAFGDVYTSTTVDSLPCGMPSEAFASGQVAHLLQGSQETQVWGQNIDRAEPYDALPVLSGDRVYHMTTCLGETIAYSNTQGETNVHAPEADDGDCTTAILCGSCGGTVTEGQSHNFEYGECANDGCNVRQTFTMTYYVDGVQVHQETYTCGSAYYLWTPEEKDGLTFLGWAETEGGEVKYPDWEYIWPAEDLTFHAVYGTVYTVRYYSYDAEQDSYFDNGTATVVAGDTLTLGEQFSYWYKCVGWATEEKGRMVYTVGQEITPTGDLDLYALVEPFSAKVELGAEDAVYDRTVISGELPYSGVILTSFPTRPGYVFTGWLDEDGMFHEPFENEEGVRCIEIIFGKDTTLTAQWELCTHTPGEDGKCANCGMAVVAVKELPETVEAEIGEKAAVTVEATGKNLTYTWYFANPGKDTFSVTTAFIGPEYSVAMSESRDGRRIYCLVTDENGFFAKTNIVTLTVPQTKLTIVTQPVDVTAGEGEKATVTFEATGDGLAYTWYYANPGKDTFSKTASFTSNTYEVTMSAARSGRRVYCVVTDKYGNAVQTDTVTLSMPMNVATIVSQSKSVWVPEGEKAVVTVEATGDGLTYKWYYKNPGATKYTYTDSFKGNTYSVTMTEARSGRYVYCKVTDKYGNTVKSKTVSVNMQTPLEIVTQPKSVKVADGEKATVTVEAQGDGLTYKWYYKDPGGTKYKYTDSFKSNTYSITMSDARSGRYVFCRVYDKYGNMVKTNTVSLRMK